MKSILSLAALTLVALGGAAVARTGGSMDPTGTWLTEDGRAKVHIDKCGEDHNDICGTIVWLKEPLDDKGKPKTDTKNPDPAKRSRPTLGMPLFVDLKPNDDDAFAGEIYNAENGKNYDVTFKMEKPSEIRVHGCMLAVLCGSQGWTRVNDVPVPVVVATGAKKIKPAAPAQ